MPDGAREQHGFLDWREAAIRLEGHVRELPDAVTADTASGHAGELQVQHLWNHRHEDRAAYSFTSGLIVVILKGRASRESGKDDSVHKLPEDAKGFHMDGTVGDGRLPGNLADNIGHLIER